MKRRERDADEIVPEAHRLGPEDARVHLRGIAGDQRLEIHAGENVADDVDARRDLDELEPVGPQREHAALGHVEHVLPPLSGISAAEGDMLDVRHELAVFGLLADDEPAVARADILPAGAERADEHDFLGVLTDVDEAAGASELGAELADVEVAMPVDLGEAEKGRVEPAAVVEIELVGR